MTQASPGFDVKGIGKHMSRQRYQLGALKSFVPAGKGKPQWQLTARYLLGAMVSIYQDPERTREEKSSGEDHYERSREELPYRNGI